MRCRLILAAVALSFSLSALGQSSDPMVIDDARIAQLDQAMRELVNTGVRQGIVWAVARDGIVLHSGAHGWQDRDAQTVMQINSLFRIYSMTRCHGRGSAATGRSGPDKAG